MRRVLAVAAAVVMLAVGAGCEPSTPEPKVAMTARSYPAKPKCYSSARIEGNINGTKTSSVVLQRTVGGKWVDWKWYQTGDTAEQPHRISTAPDYDGTYALSYLGPWSAPETVLHLRARSAGGSVVSNGVYVTVTCP